MDRTNKLLVKYNERLVGTMALFKLINIIKNEEMLMKKVIVFGSRHWPDCAPAKEFLSENGIEFIYLDITDNMLNLKRFLKYRDEAPEFKEVKEARRVGLPCIVIDNGEKIVFDYNLLDTENIKE